METFISYDRITDTMMYLSDGISLNFVVSLSSKKRDGTRSSFHSEFEKPSKYIGETNPSITVRRSFRFYYAIEIKNDFGGGIILGTEDIIPFKLVLENNVLPWFSGSTRVFDIIEDKLVLKGQYKPAVYTKSEYKYLAFVPIVFSYENGQYKEGVRCYMNTKEFFFDMTIDTLYGFLYTISNTDMYTLASTMVNYIKTPPYGINSMRLQGLASGRLDSSFNNDIIEQINGQHEIIDNAAKTVSDPVGDARNFLNKTKRKEV